jgi:hypothetical protein
MADGDFSPSRHHVAELTQPPEGVFSIRWIGGTVETVDAIEVSHGSLATQQVLFVRVRVDRLIEQRPLFWSGWWLWPLLIAVVAGWGAWLAWQSSWWWLALPVIGVGAGWSSSVGDLPAGGRRKVCPPRASTGDWNGAIHDLLTTSERIARLHGSEGRPASVARRRHCGRVRSSTSGWSADGAASEQQMDWNGSLPSSGPVCTLARA